MKESASLTCLASFNGHTENVTSVCMAPKSHSFFVSASQDNTIKLWDMPIDSETPSDISSAKLTVMAH